MTRVTRYRWCRRCGEDSRTKRAPSSLGQARRVVFEVKRRPVEGARTRAVSGSRVMRCIGEPRQAAKISAWQAAQRAEPGVVGRSMLLLTRGAPLRPPDGRRLRDG